MRRLLPIFAICCLTLLAMAAQTQINLSNQVTGILPVANAGTGAATTAAGNALAGPLTGAAAAYSFKAIPSTASAGLLMPNITKVFYIEPPGNAGLVNYLGHRGLSSPGGAESDATSTLPTRQLNDTGTEYRETAWGFTSPGHSLNFQVNAALKQTTNFYSDIGVCDTDAAGNAGCGFHAPDRTVGKFFACNNDDCTHANWQTYIKDLAGGTSHTLDTGIPVDTSFHHFMIQDNGTTWDFFIDGTNVSSYNANLPSSTKVIGVYIFSNGGGLYFSQLSGSFSY